MGQLANKSAPTILVLKTCVCLDPEKIGCKKSKLKTIVKLKRDTHTKLFYNLLLTHYHCLKAKLLMYFALSIIFHFWKVWMEIHMNKHKTVQGKSFEMKEEKKIAWNNGKKIQNGIEISWNFSRQSSSQFAPWYLIYKVNLIFLKL